MPYTQCIVFLQYWSLPFLQKAIGGGVPCQMSSTNLFSMTTVCCLPKTI